MAVVCSVPGRFSVSTQNGPHSGTSSPDLTSGDSLPNIFKKYTDQITESFGKLADSFESFTESLGNFSTNGREAYPVPEKIEESNDLKDHIQDHTKNRYKFFVNNMAGNGSSKTTISMCDIRKEGSINPEKEIEKVFEAIGSYEGIGKSKWSYEYRTGLDIQRCELHMKFKEQLQDGTEEVKLRYSRS